jgi:ribosomal protein S18 acetylase RimI-like enzyme
MSNVPRSLMRMASKGEELRRALAFMARVDEEAASGAREWSLGTALVTPELPRVWDASYFRVERPGDRDGERAGAEAIELSRAAGLAHAAVVLSDEDDAASLRRGLEAAGFEEVRFVLMALREVPPAPDAPIREASFADVAPSRRETTLELFPGDEALADQLGELDRRLEATIGGRWFAIREGDEVVSRAWLLSRGGVGQVEDVATSRSHRGRGLARGVVSAAARASIENGNDLTFVIANDGETTPELYRKTGFEPIGFKRRFVKRLEPR